MQEAASHDHKEVVRLLIDCGGAIWQDEKVRSQPVSLSASSSWESLLREIVCV